MSLRLCFAYLRYLFHGLGYVHGRIIAEQRDDDHPDSRKKDSRLEEGSRDDKRANTKEQVNSGEKC